METRQDAERTGYESKYMDVELRVAHVPLLDVEAVQFSRCRPADEGRAR